MTGINNAQPFTLGEVVSLITIAVIGTESLQGNYFYAYKGGTEIFEKKHEGYVKSKIDKMSK